MPFGSSKEFSITQQGLSDIYRLNLDVSYYDSKYTDLIITINAGFTSDGSSIPRVFWWLVGHPLQGANGIAGFLHDYILKHKLLPRKTADLILLEAHKDLGTNFWTRQKIYRAVRLWAIIKGKK